MFETLPAPRPDPILALMEDFRADPRPGKVDLGVGVYKDAAGKTPVVAAVREAERRLIDLQDTKSYVGMVGDAGFNAAMARLVFGSEHPGDRLRVVQAPGGSGALRLLFDLVRRNRPDATIWTSEPTWPNHHAIIREVGLETRPYRYFDPEGRAVDFAAMMDDLGHANAGDVVLLHGCCHNPTGANLTIDEWQAVAGLLVARGLVPFVDLAYQGFGDGLVEDAAGVRLIAQTCPELLLAVSCSKNFGLYRDRVGAAMVLGRSAAEAANASGALAGLARSNYSMPPDHGAAVVRLILEDAALRADWENELAGMRTRMLDLRCGLSMALCARAHSDRFAFIREHRGMFSLSGASAEQVRRLRQEHAIYLIGDGRMNVAGLPQDRLGAVADAFLDVGL